MGCCQCKWTQWNDPQEVVWTNDDGDEFCIFHAPRECHLKHDVDKFNKLVFRKINEAIEKNVSCDLTRIVFPGEISFSHFDNTNPLPPITFFRCIFHDKATFRKTKFNDTVCFDNALFHHEADFSNSLFVGETYFRDTIFLNFTSFEVAHFLSPIGFYKSFFQESVYFHYAHFEDDVAFNFSRFACSPSFTHACFDNVLSFDNCIFEEGASFQLSIFKMRMLFLDLSFPKDVKFHEARFLDGVEFKSTNFSGRVFFIGSTHIGNAVFYKTKFRCPSDFSYSRFVDGAIFFDSSFVKPSFAGCFTKSPIILDHIHMTEMPMIEVSIESFRFRSCCWPTKRGRHVIYDETVKSSDTNPRDLEETYRRLKRVAIEEKDFALASDWHFNEKLWKNRQTKWFIRRWLFTVTGLYRLFSGFGERPKRSFFWLLVFLLSPLLILAAMNLTSLITDFWTAAEAVTRQWVGFLPLVKAAKVADTTSGWRLLGMAFSQILISVQAALFGLALRNRLRR